MKKIVGDLTLNKIADICKKCDDGKIDHCPFLNVTFIYCFDNDEPRRIGLDKEIEVDEE